jgi:CBS domain containing-hemolysin-like protein
MCRESMGLGGPLNEEEFHVIQGVLDLGSKTGLKAMTPLDTVFMLSTEDVIDRCVDVAAFGGAASVSSV